jgi:signal peptidase I
MLGRRQSYSEAVLGRRKVGRRLGILLLVFICYELLTGLFLSTYLVQSKAMEPTLIPGDRILATPLAFGPRTLFGKLPGVSRPERGDIVIAEANYARRLGFWELLSDSFVRFFTFQLVSPSSSESGHPSADGRDRILSAPLLERVVGLPGDTIKMDDFIFKIKPAGSDQFLTEFELCSSRYDISREDPPASWRRDLPGSGHMDESVLGRDEYFLAGDGRSSSSDSRLWGPVRSERFRAKVLLRYWPFRAFGSP